MSDSYVREQLERRSRLNDAASSNHSPARPNGAAVSTVGGDLALTQMRASLDAKDSELRRAHEEARYVRDSMERVVKELVDKNKALDAEARQATARHREEVNELINEHKKCMASLIASRNEAAAAQDALNISEQQVASLKAVNRDLVDDVDAARRHQHTLAATVDDLQRDLSNSRAAEGALRDEIDELTTKLGKADGHLASLAEQAEDANIAHVKARHELTLCSEELVELRKGSEELVTRLTSLTRGLFDDTSAVLGATDSLLGLVADAPNSSTGVSTTSLQWPSDSSSGDTQLVVAMMRLRDAASLLGDDIAVAHRGVRQIHESHSEAVQKGDVLRDALQAERAQVLALAEKLEATESAVRDLEAQRGSLEAALADSSQWMSEAVNLQEERARRVDAVLRERDEQASNAAAERAKVASLQAELKALRDDMKQLEEARAEAAAAAVNAAAATRECDDAAGVLQRQLAQARADTSDATAELQRQKTAVAASKEAYDKLDTEARYMRRQLDDALAKTRSQAEQMAAMEARERQLRDQVFAAQSKYEASLRRVATTTAAAATNRDRADDAPRQVQPAAAGLTSPPRAAAAPAPAVASRLSSWEDRINAMLRPRD